jgi:ABC-type amino acid transport substrate-binding protein
VSRIPRPPRTTRVSGCLRASALAGLLLACSFAVEAASATLDRIRQTGTIQLAYREGAPPFSFRDRDGRVRGYSVELCERVAQIVGKSLGVGTVKVSWKAVDASTRLDAVASGAADIECGTTTITLARMEKVDFSVPVFVDGGSVLVRADAKLPRLVDLKNRRVAVIPGTTTEQALVAQLNTLESPATLVPVKDGAEGIAQLVAGKVDGYAGDRIVLTTLRQRAAKPAALAFVDSDFSFEPYALVVRRDDPDFRLAVNRAIVGIYRGGEIDTIFQRWFASYGQPGPLLHAMFYLNRLPE